jgi:hypothetical protein
MDALVVLSRNNMQEIEIMGRSFQLTQLNNAQSDSHTKAREVNHFIGNQLIDE